MHPVTPIVAPGHLFVFMEPTSPRSEDGALLVVSDRGSGVDHEDREAVFEPFWQGGTAPAHSPGVGIGLSLVAAFTELHGGRSWVEDAPGGGAAFHVWLPRRSSDPTTTDPTTTDPTTTDTT